MNPYLNITFTCEPEHGDMALLDEAIAGEIRLGCMAGAAPEYAWEFSSGQAGLS